MIAGGVLEVLSAVIDGDCMDEEVLLIEARAAVAELIEAADGVDATHGPMLNPRAVTPKQRQAALNRLRAALARVGGAS